VGSVVSTAQDEVLLVQGALAGVMCMGHIDHE
jgi:hypothetical protein